MPHILHIIIVTEIIDQIYISCGPTDAVNSFLFFFPVVDSLEVLLLNGMGGQVGVR